MNTDKNNQIIEAAFNALKPEELLLTEWSLDIAMRLQEILDTKGMNAEDLAMLMDKEVSEVRRWLKGMHHFSMETIAELQVALEASILEVPFKSEQAPIQRRE